MTVQYEKYNPLTNPTDNFLIIQKFEFFYLKKTKQLIKYVSRNNTSPEKKVELELVTIYSISFKIFQ